MAGIGQKRPARIVIRLLLLRRSLLRRSLLLFGLPRRLLLLSQQLDELGALALPLSVVIALAQRVADAILVPARTCSWAGERGGIWSARALLCMDLRSVLQRPLPVCQGGGVLGRRRDALLEVV